LALAIYGLRPHPGFRKEGIMRSSIRTLVCLGVLALLAFRGDPARADGPVTPAALPGGATLVSDTDTGNGQQWGRAGGRSTTYAINNPDGFSALSWGVVSGANPHLALDGTLDSSELLMFASGESDLAGSIARWTGQAALPLLGGGSVTIPTRFTLKVTRGGSPLPLFFAAGGVSPGADVLSNIPFTANFLFEMQYVTALPGGDNSWQPVLDLYDSLTVTQPGQPPSTNVGPVLTGVSTGFYFAGGTSLTLEQHDAHIAGLLGPIAGDVAFLRTEVPPRLLGLGEQAVEIKNRVNEVLSRFPSGGSLATANEVQSAIGQLQQILLILFGLFPCPPEAGPLCTTAKFVKDLSTQASVDAVMAALTSVQTQLASRASQSSVQGVKASVETVQQGVTAANVKLDALQGSLDVISGGGLDVQVSRVATRPGRLRWLVKTTRDGVLVNAILAQLVSVHTSGPNAVAQNVIGLATVNPILPGLHDVSVNVVRGVTDGNAYLFEAQLVEGAAVATGSTLVGTEKHDDN